MTQFSKWIVAALLPLALHGQTPESIPVVTQIRTSAPAISSLQVRTAKPEPLMALALGLPAPRAGGGMAAMQGPTFTIDKHVVAGGGGNSTGGGFTLEGTIGQAAAGGPLAAGSFSLDSGFWEASSSVASPKKRGGQVTSQ